MSGLNTGDTAGLYPWLHKIVGCDSNFRIVDITPDIARKLLSTTGSNRKISELVVRQYAKRFSDDKGAYIYQPILIDADGHMIDGQHRCAAVVKSGVTIKCAVIRGVPPETWVDLDQGKKRSLADIMGARGHKNTRTMSSIVMADYLYTSWSFSGPSVGANELLRIFDSNVEGFVHATSFTTRHPVSCKMLRPSIIGMLFYRTALKNLGYITDEFVTRLEDGVGLATGSPILTLRNKLLLARFGNKASKIRFTTRELIYCSVVAINKWADGSTMKKIYIPPSQKKVTLWCDKDNMEDG